MGKFESNSLQGSVGNLIFYNVNGVTYARTKPAKRKPKRGEPESQQVTAFTTVSKYGTPIIMALKKEIPFPIGRAVYSQVRGWMLNQWKLIQSGGVTGISMESTPMFQLNKEVDIRNCLLLLPNIEQVKDGILFKFPSMIPSKHIRAPKDTKHVFIKMIVLASSFSQQDEGVQVSNVLHSIPFNKTALATAEFTVPLHADEGDVTVVAIGLSYENSTGQLYNEAIWQPVALIAMGKWQS